MIGNNHYESFDRIEITRFHDFVNNNLQKSFTPWRPGSGVYPRGPGRLCYHLTASIRVIVANDIMLIVMIKKNMVNLLARKIVAENNYPACRFCGSGCL